MKVPCAGNPAIPFCADIRLAWDIDQFATALWGTMIKQDRLVPALKSSRFARISSREARMEWWTLSDGTYEAG